MTETLNKNRKHIVIVDDNPVNLDLAESVLKDTYKITKLISGEQLLKFMGRIQPDMILLDIQMPGINGYETLSQIKKNPDLCNIPVIFITGQKDSASETFGFRLGAQDFIGKPFDNEVTLSRINSQMELYQYRNDLEGVIYEKTRHIEDLQHVITVSWAEMVESRDGTTGSHVRNTARYYDTLLHLLAQCPEYCDSIDVELINDYVRASIIHDIGKIGISDQILKKPGPLSVKEFELMKNHSQIGADTIQKIIDSSHMNGFLLYAKELALYHHERWDGTGYPTGLSKEQISPYVAGLSIADVYDALTSVRPYKKAYSHQEAMDIMKEDRGIFFSPRIFDIFWDNQDSIQKLLDSKED